MTTEQEVHQYLEDLDDENIHVREAARQSLLDADSDIVPDLINMLKTDRQRCRWEAARLLGKIRDERALEPLVESLLDESVNVHWIASESLIQYGHQAILPLLRGITRHFESMRFRQGAYHILHMMERFGHLDPHTQEVLNSLRSLTPAVSAPWAAERAIEAILYEHARASATSKKTSG